MPSINSANKQRWGSQPSAPATLTPPPRSIPWPVCGRVLFGGVVNQFGWAWLAFSMFFVTIAIGSSGLKDVFFSVSRIETAPGVVLNVEETNSSENDQSIYAIRYTFRDQREADYSGVSYTTSFAFAEGQNVQVEYQAATPATSRIRGTRVSPFGRGIMIMLLFPLIGVLLLAGGLRLGIRGLRLLRSGAMAQGTLVSKQRTNTRINEQMVYKLTFDFVDATGSHYQTSAKTHRPETLEDESMERVLYDPGNPSYAVLFDNLPGQPAVDELGRILPGSLLKTGLIMILPAVTLLIVVLMFV
jgi:hypothetical protein